MDTLAFLPSEVRLVVVASRPAGAERDDAIRRLLRERVDWGVVGAIALREKLLPVVAAAVGPFVGGSHADGFAPLQRRAGVEAFRLALTARALDAACRLFAAQGIPCLLLKGAALVSSVYERPTDRPMGDLDVLVPADRADEAWHLLRGDGWDLESAPADEFYDAHQHLLPLVAPSSAGVVLELHRALLPAGAPLSMDEAGLWARSREVVGAATTVRLPAPEDLLLHLAVHFAWQHMMSSGALRSARDVAALVRAEPVDWQTLEARAIEARAASSLYWTLRLANRLVPSEIPVATMRQLSRFVSMGALDAGRERALIAQALLEASPSVAAARWLWSSAIQPARQGHGVQRPWETGERFAQARHRSTTPAPMHERMWRHARSLRRWARFARVLASPAGSTARSATATPPAR